MEKENFSGYEGFSILMLAMSANALTIPYGRDAGSDIWLAILLGILYSFPIFLMYSKILSLYSGKNLFDILFIVFTKPVAKLFILLFVLFAFFIGAAYLQAYGLFLITTSITETPSFVPVLMMITLSIWMVKNGIKIIGMWSKLFLIFNAPLPTIIILLLIPQIDINNITPVLYNGFKPVLMSSFATSTLVFGESVIFSLFLFSFSKNTNIKKVFLSALLLSGGLTLAVSTTAILVLGPNLYETAFFPVHIVSTKINVRILLQRLDPIILVSITTAGFLKTCVSLYVCSKGIASLCNISNYTFIVTPTALIIFSLALFLFDSIPETWTFAMKVYPLFGTIFIVILPLIILTTAFYKKSKFVKVGG